MTQTINWDAVYLSNHSARLTRGMAWFQSAIELVAAAEAIAPMVTAYWTSMARWEKDKGQLFNEHTGQPAFLMLYAFACENYSKGYLAERLSFEERDKLAREGVFQSASRHTICCVSRRMLAFLSKDYRMRNFCVG